MGNNNHGCCITNGMAHETVVQTRGNFDLCPHKSHSLIHVHVCRYKRNLRALYVVHPTWWFKVKHPLLPSLTLTHTQLQAWWFLTFTAGEIKDRVHYLTGVQYLYDTINPDQIDIPQFVMDHDQNVSSLPASSSSLLGMLSLHLSLYCVLDFVI